MTTLTDARVERAELEGSLMPSVEFVADGAVCDKRDYCVLTAGHKGLCRKFPEGTAPPPPKRKGQRGRPKRPAGSSSPPGSSARAPSRRSGRSSELQMFLAFAWDKFGKQVERSVPEPTGPPVGRCLQFEAPYVAARLHPALRKVPIYRRMDEAAGGFLEELIPIIAAPMLVGIMANNADAREFLSPYLVAALEPMIVEMVATRRQQKEQLSALHEHDEEARALLEELVGALFAPTPAPPAAPDEAAR